MRVILALHPTDLATRTRSTKTSSGTTATQEIYISNVALRARKTWSCCTTEADCVGSGHRTKRVANDNPRDNVEPIVRFGSGKPKLLTHGVGVNLGEAISANTAPLSRSYCIVKEVDVALVVAMSTGEGNPSGSRLSCSHSMIDLGHLKRGGESIVDRRHDSLR